MYSHSKPPSFSLSHSLSLCLFLSFLLSSPLYAELSPHDYCAFCDPDILNRQKFYEDDLVLALYTHKPVIPGHCLVIPKRHVERFEGLTEIELGRIGEILKKVDQAARKVFHTSAYLLLQKNGEEVGQTVPHVHFHYMPRQEGDSSTLSFLFKMLIANLKKPISPEEMEEITQQMQHALNE